jgi:hypothetical protein
LQALGRKLLVGLFIVAAVLVMARGFSSFLDRVQGAAHRVGSSRFIQ